MEVLKKLLFLKTAKFSDLKVENITSDLLSYHLRELVERGLIVKSENGYSLSSAGVDFAGRMDTDTKKIEKQPKVTMVLIVRKIEAGITYFLIQRRKKQPYFNFVGFPTGKLRYGETVIEGADRELLEEANIKARFTHSFVLHEMVYGIDKNILEDKFFNIMSGEYTSGEIKDVEGGENFWSSLEEFYKLSPKYHNEDEIFNWYLNGQKDFVEKKYIVEGF